MADPQQIIVELQEKVAAYEMAMQMQNGFDGMMRKIGSFFDEPALSERKRQKKGGKENVPQLQGASASTGGVWDHAAAVRGA